MLLANQPFPRSLGEDLLGYTFQKLSENVKR